MKDNLIESDKSIEEEGKSSEEVDHPQSTDKLIVLSDAPRKQAKSLYARRQLKEKTRILAENIVQKAAFEYYYNLGSDRNFNKVAENFNIPLKSVYNWSAKFKWVMKAQEKDLKVNNDTRLHAEAQINKVKKAVLDIIADRITSKITINEDGTVKVEGLDIKNVKEMKEAVELYRELLGEVPAAQSKSAQESGVKVQLIIKGR